MKNKSLLFLVAVLFLSSGCLLKKNKSASPVSTNTSKSTNTGGGGGTGGTGGGSSVTVDPSTLKFHYALQISNNNAGVVVVSPAFPSAGSPVIDSASAVTTLVAPSEPVDQAPVVTYVAQQSTASAVAVTNALGTPRSHDILLTTNATSCSSTMSLNCVVNSGNPKLLNLSTIDTSTFTASTTSFSLTVDGGSLSVPMGQNLISKMQNHDATSGAIQLEFRTIGEGVALGDYIYFTGNASISGSNISALYRVHKTTHDARLVFNPNQGLSGGGQVRYLQIYNNELYFTARTSTTGDFGLIKYNPTSGAITRISSDVDLLNASLLTVHNNFLYFKANSTGGFARLYKMNTTGNIKQLTNLCANKSDVGQKMISSPIGLYVSLSDSTQCGTTNTYFAVSRIKNDDTIVPLSIYSPGIVDNTNDGLGSITDYNGAYYFSGGNNYFLYQDNNDGTTTPLIRKGGWGAIPVPITKFVKAGSSLYWVGPSNLFRYDLVSKTINRIYNATGFYDSDFFSLGNSAYILFRPMSGLRKIYKIDSNDNLQLVSDINGAANDDILSRNEYNNELYFYSKNAAGFYKFFKMTSDSRVFEISDITSGSNEAPAGTYNITGTSAGIFFSSTNFANGQYLIQ